MSDVVGARGLRLVLRALLASVALVVAGCSGDGEDATGTSTTTSDTETDARTFEQRDAALQLNIAATGMNLVASDVSLRTVRGEGAEYCRAVAPGELEPHRSTLQAAGDESVRALAEAALGELEEALTSCAEGAAPPEVQEAIQRYNASFERLRQRIDALLAPSAEDRAD